MWSKSTYKKLIKDSQPLADMVVFWNRGQQEKG